MASPIRRAPRSFCPIATTLEFVGDRWTLVIVRDLLNGKRRFSEFLGSPERITTNILTGRLADMERDGLIEKTAYQTRPLRHEYRLTARGAALLPVLLEMCLWGQPVLAADLAAAAELRGAAHRLNRRSRPGPGAAGAADHATSSPGPPPRGA
jgi:DNA-binding HxlR family transcriptional regulator